MKLKKLFTKRLVLEPQVLEHSEVLYKNFKNINLYEFIARKPPNDFKVFAEGIRSLENRTSPDGKERWFNWVLFSKTKKASLGQIEVSLIIKDSSKTLINPKI